MNNLIPAPQLKLENTLRDALTIVEDKSWMIVAIVDDQEKFVGIVSAGDLRRAILNGHSVDATLEAIVNRNPVTITGEPDSPNVHQLFDQLKSLYGGGAVLYAMIPVLSADRKVLGLINLNTLTADTGEEAAFIKPHKQTVLVVGGAGYIGSVLTRLLLKRGWNVRVLDRQLYSKDSLKGLPEENFTLIEGNAHDIDTMVSAVEGVDAVVYLAELVGDPACSVAPQTALKTNYLAVASLAHLCSHLNINRFVYTSSCSVYGASANPSHFLDEESPLEPVSLYARMKVLVEQAILLVRHLPNPSFSPTVLRLGTVFGYSYRPRFDLVVNAFVKNAMHNGEIDVMGGDQWRPNVHVTDVAGAISAVLEAPISKVRGQVFNVGSNEENHTIDDLAMITKEVFPELVINRKAHAVDKRNYRVNFSKIEEAIGFKAQVSVRQGMEEIKEALEQGGYPVQALDGSEFSNLKRTKELNLA